MFANLEGGRGEHSVACNACCNCVDVDRTMKMAENERGRRITLKKGCLLYYYYSSSFFPFFWKIFFSNGFSWFFRGCVIKFGINSFDKFPLISSSFF